MPQMTSESKNMRVIIIALRAKYFTIYEYIMFCCSHENVVCGLQLGTVGSGQLLDIALFLLQVTAYNMYGLS